MGGVAYEAGEPRCWQAGRTREQTGFLRLVAGQQLTGQTHGDFRAGNSIQQSNRAISNTGIMYLDYTLPKKNANTIRMKTSSKRNRPSIVPTHRTATKTSY